VYTPTTNLFPMASETSAPLALTSVLVTGGSGFIGSYLILGLLKAGYTVRTTVRNLSRELVLRETLQSGGASAEELQRLSVFAADLKKDDGWSEAVAGSTYVHHVASPFPLELPKHENDLILPARDGTLRVLRAADAANVKRVILTSSCAAITYGQPPRAEDFTEEDWTNLDGKIPVPPYQKSKTIAEKAAWDFMESKAGEMELVTVNPCGVFGPILGTELSTSIQLVKKLMDGSVPGCPNISLDVVDVRDVVSLHMLAMTKAEAKGRERYIAVNDEKPRTMIQFGQLIKTNRADYASKVPTLQIPNFVVQLLSYFDASLKQLVPELGVAKHASSEKAKKELGWAPRSTDESILDTVDSLIRFGLVTKSA